MRSRIELRLSSSRNAGSITGSLDTNGEDGLDWIFVSPNWEQA